MTVTLPVTYTKLTEVATEPRENFYVRVPERRQVDVYHEQTGEAYQLQLNFTAISQRVASPRRERNPAANSNRMGGNCQVQNGMWLSQNEFLTRWQFPITPGDCATRATSAFWGQQETVTTSELSVVYTLGLPPTHRVKPGVYRGSVTYTLGAGGDFDFGNNVTALNGNSVTVNIVLDVQHSFLLDFPLGFDRAVLDPPGGWSAWLDGGRVPPRLSSDLSMRLWSTGPFKVYKQCEYDVGDGCGIRNRRGEEVALKVAITLPYGIRYQGWQTVNKMALPTGQAAALELQSILPTVNGPSQLHFEVAQDDLRPMLERGGELYSGKVTVIFDAEP
ncbi:hypothetical protein [Pseudomonas putida]|uniref:hypothetical protein n=1 Tax=Pseudomonas putida TaxID=303 RepID=UPI002366792F|nr:hypothetical protein [Pseudomonas putida]MDD2046437.1 hypothetical protein [Pseudomonas putida]